LAADGLPLTVADVDGEAADRVAHDVGGEAWQVDLADTASLADLSLDVDVLVNNTGIQHVAPVHEFPPERFVAGLEGLSKVVALEGGEHGVPSNCVCPGCVRTPLVEEQIADQAAVHGIDEAEVVEQVMLTETAIKRLVEPDEVAELVAWVAGPAASYVNGASLTTDGGWTAR
jgi:3-hydroxybutyrate dehydrogenase